MKKAWLVLSILLLLTLVKVHGQYMGKAIVNDSTDDSSWHQGINYDNFKCRAPAGCWTCYLAGLGGTHGQNSYSGMDWSPWAGGDMVRWAANPENGFGIDIIMQYSSGLLEEDLYCPNSDCHPDPDSAYYAATNGCAVFTFLEESNIPRNGPWDYRTWLINNKSSTGGSFLPQIYGVGPVPAMTVSSGYWNSPYAITSYGPQIEFIDTIWDGDPYYDYQQSFAHAATAARYARLKSLHPTWNVFDLRQELRQTCTYYDAGWTPDRGYGFPLVLNNIGDGFPEEATINGKSLTDPNLDLTDLDAGPPIQPSALISPDGTQFIFRWYNFLQTYFASTVITVNGTVIYDGDGTSFAWTPTVSGGTAEFFTKLILPDETVRLSRNSTNSALEPYTTIQLPPDLPGSFTDSFTTFRNTSIDFNAFGNNPALSLVSVYPDNGTATINADHQTIHIVPQGSFVGTANLICFVQDGDVQAEAIVTVNVTAPSGNQPPTVSQFQNQTLQECGTIDIPFTVSDDYTVPDNLVITAKSSDTGLIPNNNLTVLGSGNNRTLRIHAGTQYGRSSTITLTVKDEDSGVTTRSFQATVNLGSTPALSPVGLQSDGFHFTIFGPNGSSVQIMKSDDLLNWTSLADVTLSGNTYPFVDTTIGSSTHRFYRASGPDGSYINMIGFIQVPVPGRNGSFTGGYAYIANQLNFSGGLINSYMNIFHGQPINTTVNKFNYASWNMDRVKLPLMLSILSMACRIHFGIMPTAQR